MNNVNLTPEGRLLVQSFDSASRSSNSFKDITAVAHHYLFEQIELPSDTTVRSIFLLLSHNSTLRNIYSRYLPDEMLHEAFASSIPYDLSGGIDPSEVEYTEVFRVFEKNTADTSLSGLAPVMFHGVGFVRQEPLWEAGNIIGDVDGRTYYSFEFTSCRRILDLPLRFSTEVSVCEEDPLSPKLGRKIDVLKVSEMRLGELLQVVLEGSACIGAPEADDEP